MKEKVTVENVVKKLVAEHLMKMPSDFDCNWKFEKDLGTDSLDMVEIAMAAEKEFEIEISNDEVWSITTVGDLVSCVERHLDGKPIETQKWRDRQ